MITELEIGLHQAERQPLHVIALAGPIGAGKSTLAAQLVARDRRWQRVSFAEALKNMVVQMTGVPITDDNKALYRKTLQDFGQLMRALHGKSYWSQRAVQSARVRGYTHIIIDDWRFQDELRYLQEAADHVYPVKLVVPQAVQHRRHLDKYGVPLDPAALYDESEHDLDQFHHFKATIDSTQPVWWVVEELEQAMRRHYVDYRVGRGPVVGDLVAAR